MLKKGKLFCILDLAMDMNFPLTYKVNLRSKLGNKSLYVTKNCLANHILSEMVRTRVSNYIDTEALWEQKLQL